MVAAPDAGLFDLAIQQRGTAVTTARNNQTGSAAEVAKQQEIFAEEAYLLRKICSFVTSSEGMPVATQEFATSCAGADIGVVPVVCWLMVSSVAGSQVCSGHRRHLRTPAAVGSNVQKP